MSDWPIPSKRSFGWKILATLIGQIFGIIGKIWLSMFKKKVKKII
jgi:hypothetical protein